MEAATVYPTRLEQKILAQEAPGGPPANLNVVIPSVTRPGEPFEVKVSVLDAAGYPSVQCNGCVEIQFPGGGTAGIDFRTGMPAAGMIEAFVLPADGLFRLEARCGSLQAYSNPTLCTEEDLPGIYWGDPHVHTVLSDCHPDRCRSLNFCFTAARHVTALDWVAAADHVSNGRCEFARWKAQSAAANLYDDPPRFATIPAYEESLKGGAGGDNNVYMARFPEMFVDEYEDGNVRTLHEKLLNSMEAGEFFIVPHHTSRPGKHGEIPDDIYPGADAMPLIEVHSKWGTSEYRGNPNALHEVHTGPSYAQDLLARGLRLGFIGGTDTHTTMPSGGGEEPGRHDRLPGFTAVRSRELSRNAVFSALQRRQCYATSLERIILHGSVGGVEFGRAKRLKKLEGPLRIEAVAAGQSDIERIDLVRNGEDIETVRPNDWQAKVAFEDKDPRGSMLDSKHLGRFVYYYLRVTCRSGAQAWSSPVWITDGGAQQAGS